VLPTAVSSCNFTQFLHYNHRPLVTTFFPCSVLWPPQEALCPSLHNTCLHWSYLCDAHSGLLQLWIENVEVHCCSKVIKRGSFVL
jgi:hypothetical protein